MEYELIIQTIVKHLVLSHDKVIGIVIADHKLRAYIKEEVEIQLAKVFPKYLAPTLVRHDRNLIETKSKVKLMFFADPLRIHGYSFDILYVNEEIELQHLSPMARVLIRI